MNPAPTKDQTPKRLLRNRAGGCASFRRVIELIVLLGVLWQANWRADAQPAALTEYQVKALFLLNFTKYIDWPVEAFPETNSLIIIGVIGHGDFDKDLAKVVAGRSVGGHKLMIVPLETENDWGKCHVLFITASQKNRIPEILAKVKGQPVLTVGETDQFIQQGGIVNFTKKEGKVRLEIDLNAAHQARLQISSKLLNVADLVRGKP